MSFDRVRADQALDVAIDAVDTCRLDGIRDQLPGVAAAAVAALIALRRLRDIVNAR